MDPSKEINKTDNAEYPRINNKKDLVSQLEELSDYQKTNSTEIQKTSFYGASAEDKDIKHIILSNQIFKDCNFQSSNFVSDEFNDCIFIDCIFSGATFYNIKFNHCTFTSCNFTDAKMQDVYALDCSKTDCIFTNTQFTHTKGFKENDENVIEQNDEETEQNDEVSEIDPQPTDIKSANLVKVAVSQLKGWEEVQDGVFELNFVGDDNGGIALYSNPEKNETEENDIWELVFFIGDQSVFMSDFDFFGKKSEDIKTIISDWKENLSENSESIFKNILTLLKDNE